MTARLRILAAGPGASVQDRGRRGYLRYGVSESGPMDWARHALALGLAGEPAGGPAIEFGPGGVAVAAEGGTIALGLAAPGFSARLEDAEGARAVEPPLALTLAPGARLVLRAGARGLWGYLAAAGLDPGPAVLGSHAVHARTGLGGAPLAPGAAFACDEAPEAPPRPVRDPLEGEDGPLRLLPGPQHHRFGRDALAAVVSAPYAVTPRQDRMGVWLDGPALRCEGGHDIVSDGVVEGAVQVPGSGQPVVLLADRQPTGGYPKIAVLARADRPRLAQARAGETLRFAWETPEGARAACRARAEAVAAPEPRPRAELTSAFLLSVDLVSGVWGE